MTRAGSRPGRRSSKVSSITPEELRIGALLWPERVQRPKIRGDCANVARPCPYVGCRHHLYLDVRKDRIAFNVYGREVWDLEHSCSLDYAELGGMSLQEVADAMSISRERARQILDHAIAKLAKREARASSRPPTSKA